MFFSFEQVQSEYLLTLEGEFKKRELAVRRKTLQGILNKDDLTEERRRKFERHLWVIDGMLVYNFSIARLCKVSKIYERLGLVPEGYEQPDLFFENEKPQHLQRLQERINAFKSQ